MATDFSERLAKAREAKKQKEEQRNAELESLRTTVAELKQQIEEQASKDAERELKKANAKIERLETQSKPSIPWKPARILDIPEDLKDSRFVYRFVNSKAEGNELKKQNEGWEYDTEVLRKMKEKGLFVGRRTLQDGTPTDSVYTLREMVLMRIPKEMAEARNKYYQERAEAKSKRFKQDFDAAIRTEGGDERARTYSEHKEEREIIRR